MTAGEHGHDLISIVTTSLRLAHSPSKWNIAQWRQRNDSSLLSWRSTHLISRYSFCEKDTGKVSFACAELQEEIEPQVISANCRHVAHRLRSMVIQPIIERARWGILDAATRSWYRIMHGIEIPGANRSREAWLSMAMSKSWNSSTLRKELTAHLREHPASLPWLQSEETLQVMRLTSGKLLA